MVDTILLTVVLQLIIIHVPLLQTIFKTVSLNATELGVSLLLSTMVFVAIELQKWWKHR